MAFDIQGARKEGYSDREIADYLASQKKFDVTGARKEGYRDDEIISHLSSFEPKREKPKEPGLIDRATGAIKELVSGPGSVMDKVPTTPPGQKEVDERLALGQGPIRPEVVQKARDVREGIAKLEEQPETVKRVAKVLEEKKEPTFRGLVDRATELQQIEDQAETARRKQFARERPLLSSLQSGLATTLAGNINIPSVAADAFNQTFVNPILTVAGLDPLPKVPLAYGTEYLAKAAEEYMPSVGKQKLGEAFDKKEATDWLFSNLAANSPQMVMSLAGAYAPALRATILPAMGGTAAGSSYAAGDQSQVAVAKGAVEVLTEMLPLQVFDKVGDVLKGLSVPKQRTILTIAGQRLAKTGADITAVSLTNAVEEAAAQFGGNVLDKYFQGKDVALTDDLLEASVLGAASGTAMTAPRAAMTLAGRGEPLTPEQQIAQALEAGVAGAQPVGTREEAVRALSPQTYDQTLISPQETVNTQTRIEAISQATTVDDAISAATEAVGETPLIRSYAPSLAPVAAAPLTAPEPILGGVATPEAMTPEAVPVITPPAVELPEPDVALEQQFGLDKLRQAPRPQRIQGRAVADLSDDDLRAVVEDDAAPAITRRGAQIELDARSKEVAATTVPSARAGSQAVLATTPEVAATTAPRVDSIERLPVGPGSIKPRVIAEDKPLYRETNTDGIDGLLREDKQFTPENMFVTDNKDIALGQGKNKGVLVEFRPNSLSGEENVKPMTGELAGREYKADISAPRAVQSITFTDPKELKAVRGLTGRTLMQEFDRSINDAGQTVFTRKPQTPTPEVSRGTTENFIDIPADVSTEALPDADAEPVGGVAAADRARAIAQEAVDRWAAAENRTDGPVLNPAPAEEGAAVNQIAQALNSQLGGKVYAFHDAQPDAVNGFALGGTAFVNTASPSINIGKTSLHEFKHTVEQIAEAERRQGLTDTPAQQFTSSIDSIFTDMTEEGKRAYAENFLHKAELNAIADPAARERRLQELLQEPLLVSEMTADFLGNRATDKAFWQDVARTDPEGFSGFVSKWIKIIDNLLATLRGPAKQAAGESAKVDQYIRDLNKAKAVARDALIAYRRGRLTTEAAPGAPAMSLREGEGREANIPGRGEGVQPSPERAGPAAGEAGRGEVPSYGEAREGAISVVGRHYSPRVQTRLNSAYYGTGLRGAEAGRLRESKDFRIGNRIYFYVDTGNGIRPESGVGRFAHEVRLNNIYDPATRLIPPQGNSNAFESAVIDAGFDGYIAPFGRGAAVVLLGPQHDAVPVKSLEQVPAFAKKQKVEEPQAEEVKPEPGKYRDIANSLGLSEAQYRAGVLGLMTGQTKSKTFETPLVGGIPEVVQWLSQRYADSGMAPLDLKDAGDRTILAKMMAAEAVAAIRSAGTAVEWYDDTVRKTLQIMAVKYPELNTDQNARNAFLMAVAISSQTMNVEDNLRYASKQYESFRETGRYPEEGTGKSAPAMAKNFALANSLLDEMGPDLLRRFLQTEFTKRELESIGFKIGGESMDETMLGSAVFGPKIGFGFYSNLSGNFEPVTMDMWFMRTIGRLTGKLPAFEEKLFNQQVAKLRSAIGETGDSGAGVYAADFDQALVDEAMKSDEGAIALARAVYSLHNRQFIKERAKFDAGERKKTKLVSAATAILKSADKPKDSPSSGGERQRLRDVVRQMVKLVEEQTGKRVPPAALQALIWYPEQELYKKLGVKLRVTSQDYAGAAQSLLTKEGFDGKRIRAAAESGPRPARSVADGKVARPAAEAGAKGEKLGPLKGEERAAFVGPRIAERLREEANAKPLADVFAGLEKRGLAKTKMASLVERRDDAARINYVQENFLDILSELEDSGKVKINCD